MDSPPGPLSDQREDRHEVSNVITILRSISIPIQKRSDVKDVIMSYGFSEEIALWMTTNVKWNSKEKNFSWRFDIDGIEAMLNDYFKKDFWSLLEESDAGEIHFIRVLYYTTI